MQVKSVKTGSVFWAACTSLSYFYMVSMLYQFIEMFNKDATCNSLFSWLIECGSIPPFPFCQSHMINFSNQVDVVQINVLNVNIQIIIGICVF